MDGGLRAVPINLLGICFLTFVMMDFFFKFNFFFFNVKIKVDIIGCRKYFKFGYMFSLIENF